MDTDPMVPSPTLMATTLSARGLLMLSLLLMLMPITMDIPPMDTDPMVPTPTTDLMDITLLARGLLMLSPLLMLTTTDMLPPMPTDPMVLTPTEPDTTDTFKLPISTKDLPSSRNENQ